MSVINERFYFLTSDNQKLNIRKILVPQDYRLLLINSLYAVDRNTGQLAYNRLMLINGINQYWMYGHGELYVSPFFEINNMYKLLKQDVSLNRKILGNANILHAFAFDNDFV